MPIKLIEKIVWNALPFGLEEIIPSTMGEPLLYPEFESIIKICEDTGIYLNLTTNGSFPRKPVEEWAKLLLPICSDIKISWNAITPKIQETIMKGSNNIRRIEVLDKFQQARDKLYKISGYYCRLTLQMTFMKKNLLEIPKMIRFAYDHNIDRIKGHQLWILSAEMEKQALNKDNASIQEWNQMVKEAHQINTKLAEMYGYELILENFNGLKKIDNETDTNTNLKNEKNLEFSNIPENWECPFLQKEAWIAWDGVFNICCAPDDLRQTFGKWGNANEHDFMELWNNNKLKTFAKNYKSNPICNECLMRRPIEPCQISNLKEKKVNFAPRKRLL